MALLAFWSLALWGSLLLVLTVWGAVVDGPGVAVSRLLPGPGASLWAWVNALSAALALVGWLCLLGLGAWSRRDRGHQPDTPPSD
jgi:hypothetical protein